MWGRGVRLEGSREVNLGVGLIFVDPKEKGGVNFGVRHNVTWEEWWRGQKERGTGVGHLGQVLK